MARTRKGSIRWAGIVWAGGHASRPREGTARLLPSLHHHQLLVGRPLRLRHGRGRSGYYPDGCSPAWRAHAWSGLRLCPCTVEGLADCATTSRFRGCLLPRYVTTFEWLFVTAIGPVPASLLQRTRVLKANIRPAINRIEQTALRPRPTLTPGAAPSSPSSSVATSSCAASTTPCRR